MPITSINQQPAAGSLNASYRPIVFQVTATRTDGQPVPPVVYADLYINGTYYRTQSRTQPVTTSTTDSTWRFDIQDLCQQVLRPRLVDNGGSVILPSTTTAISVQVLFRSSGYTTAGFVQPEGTAPVQGTGNTPPVAGTGTASNTSFVVLATLQHASNQQLAAHLGYYQFGTWMNAYPLTHRPFGTRVGLFDTDYYPIFQTGTAAISQLRLMYRSNATDTYSSSTVSVTGGSSTPGVYLVPFGTANLTPLFPVITSWLNVYDYIIQGLDGGNNIIFTSTSNRICRCAVADKVRVHFLNYLGQYDVLQFNRPQVIHEDDGDTYVTGMSATFSKPDSSLHRWNVRGNDTYELTVKCLEREMLWIQELADSPSAYMEWQGIEGQPNSYLPLIKQKGSFPKVKNDGSDYEYFYAAQFILGNPVIAIRG